MIKTVENHYNIEIEITDNKLDIEADFLFNYATRNNSKRKFLFVSNVLGKHMSVKPSDAILIGKLLGVLYQKENAVDDSKKMLCDSIINDIKTNLGSKEETKQIKETLAYSSDVEEKTSVIAFAETATSLGHIVFDTFKNGHVFYHTTREQVDFEGDIVSFEEEHSHATSHLVYEDAEYKIESSSNIVLVDDEISTGNTILNIIKSLKDNYDVKKFSVLTIMDLRNEENIDKFRQFEKEHNLEINVISVLKGQIKNVENLSLTLDEIKKHEIFVKDYNVELPAAMIKKIEVGNYSVTEKYNKGYLDTTGRFGISGSSKSSFDELIDDTADILSDYVMGKTLVLGTEEFMYIPMMIANKLEGDISFKSTTRSPIYPCNADSYPIKSGVRFKSLYNPSVNNFIYNLKEEEFETILVVVEKTNELDLNEINNVLSSVGKRVYFVLLTEDKKSIVNHPAKMGSYKDSDVVFLLKDISKRVTEQSNEEREKAIQSGVHYSEMLPIEYRPTEKYLEIFHSSLKVFSKKIARSVAICSEKILKVRGKNVVLASLARAGTPAGILMKRYIKEKHGLDLFHYSVSIIRGKGIDENAIKYILDNHPNSEIQFVDGWTGKGAITKELKEAVDSFNDKYGEHEGLKSHLAVLADPGHTVKIFGTKEDFLIPNACLNSTISGLLSRTFKRDDLIKKDDYHGVKYYSELLNEDLSNYYIEEVENEFPNIAVNQDQINDFDINVEIVDWEGLNDVKNIERDFNIESIHFIKPGIGETTRVLLRRIPWKILISENAKNIEHVLQLAKEKNIPVETYPLKAYYCCGIVKSLKGE